MCDFVLEKLGESIVKLTHIIKQFNKVTSYKIIFINIINLLPHV